MTPECDDQYKKVSVLAVNEQGVTTKRGLKVVFMILPPDAPHGPVEKANRSADIHVCDALEPGHRVSINAKVENGEALDVYFFWEEAVLLKKIPRGVLYRRENTDLPWSGVIVRWDTLGDLTDAVLGAETSAGEEPARQTYEYVSPCFVA
jgi:hypothetical protein